MRSFLRQRFDKISFFFFFFLNEFGHSAYYLFYFKTAMPSIQTRQDQTLVHILFQTLSDLTDCQADVME